MRVSRPLLAGAALAALLFGLTRAGASSGSAASFEVIPPNPAVNQLVHFRDTTTPQATNWFWDFGDGGRSNLPSPTHVYTTARRWSVFMSASSFAAGSQSLARVVEVSPEDTLRLNAAHSFDVTLAALDQRTGRAGAGKAIPQNDLFGYFAIPALTSNPDNPEVFVKILDGTAVNGEFWVFYGGLTDLEYTLTVRENQTGRIKTFRKEGGSATGGFDTSGFRRTPTPTACPSGSIPTPRPTPTPIAGAPVLSVPMIDLTKVTQFHPFGFVEGLRAPNPHWELRTEDRTLDVRAVSPGQIVAVNFNPVEDDFEIHIRPNTSSPFLLIYDHVKEVTLAVGATVAPGTVLGKIGHRGSIQGRTELQINRGPSPEIALCPSQLGTPAFNQAHADALAATGLCAPLCLADTVTP